MSREVARNGGRVKYRAVAAEQRAQEQERRPKPSALDNPVLRQLVIDLLDNEWSPEQIVGHLRLMHAGNPVMRISHEARTELGHLEGDLIVGAKNSQIATLVDRKSRYLTMVALPSRHTTTVIPALQQAFSRMDACLRSTLTWDRGMELAGHRLLTEATGVDVYFAAPRSPWQRGTSRTAACSPDSPCSALPDGNVHTRLSSASRRHPRSTRSWSTMMAAAMGCSASMSFTGCALCPGRAGPADRPG